MKTNYVAKKIIHINIWLDMWIMMSLDPNLWNFPMIGYVKHFKADRKMSFKADDKRLFERYTEIWEKIAIYLVKNLIVSHIMMMIKMIKDILILNKDLWWWNRN